MTRLLAFLLVSLPFVAQAQTFEPSDVRKLRWITGRWAGSASGERPIFESYRVVNDSTLEITFGADSSFSRTLGGARVYLSAGRIYYAAGPSVWTATRVEERSIHFVPYANATGSVTWAQESSSGWTATLREGLAGREQVTIYRMRRLR